MDPNPFLQSLPARALAEELSAEEALRVLSDPELPLLSLVHAAYEVRKRHFGHGVQIHIINNAANGHCPEDCKYCSQAKTSETSIEKYRPKEEEEILAEARRAQRAGAHRYCMVFSGRGPSHGRTRELARIVARIKRELELEVCVSAGLLDDERAGLLKQAGLDRYNHNLNTSEEHYREICTTHTYADRLRTVRAARGAGLEVCSGLIVGMGESAEEIVEIATTLGELGASSIPVNFLLPFEGAPLGAPQVLTPEYCVRVLCMFRFVNPRAEVRIAAGRERHLRALQVLALYPANSLFLEGYLNSRGAGARQTLQMIRDAGFDIVSDVPLDRLLGEQPDQGPLVPAEALKSRRDLRPTL